MKTRGTWNGFLVGVFLLIFSITLVAVAQAQYWFCDLGISQHCCGFWGECIYDAIWYECPGPPEPRPLQGNHLTRIRGTLYFCNTTSASVTCDDDSTRVCCTNKLYATDPDNPNCATPQCEWTWVLETCY